MREFERENLREFISSEELSERLILRRDVGVGEVNCLQRMQRGVFEDPLKSETEEMRVLILNISEVFNELQLNKIAEGFLAEFRVVRIPQSPHRRELLLVLHEDGLNLARTDVLHVEVFHRLHEPDDRIQLLVCEQELLV